MKNSEEAIAKVLAGLRDAEAPDGIEGRILRALEDEPMRSGAIWRWRPMWMVVPESPVAALSLACGLALAGVFVVVLAMPAIRRLGHAPAASSARPSAPLKSNSTSVESPAAADVAVNATNAELHSGRSVRTLGTTNVRAKANTESTKVFRDRDSVARNEMHDASFPAPPMPLTEQERLLLRIAHKGDPVEVAELDSKQRDQQGLKEKAEYQRFFARPPIEQPAAAQEELTPEKAAEGQQTTPQATPEQSRTGDNR